MVYHPFERSLSWRRSESIETSVTPIEVQRRNVRILVGTVNPFRRV